MNTPIMAAMLVSLASGVVTVSPVRPALLSAYDANGRRIGRVMDMRGPTGAFTEASVPVRISGTTVVLLVSKDAITSAGPALGYEASDCTGTGFLTPIAGDLLPRATIAGPGWTVYAEQPGPAVRLVTFNSQSTKTGGCTTSSLPIVAVKAFPAVPLLDLRTLFTPPFSVH